MSAILSDLHFLTDKLKCEYSSEKIEQLVWADVLHVIKVVGNESKPTIEPLYSAYITLT